MTFLQIFIVALVAFEHIYFMILEMFLWDKPRGLKAFGMTLEDAKKPKHWHKIKDFIMGF